MRLDSALVQSVVTATLAALLASCGTFSPEPPSVQSLRTDPASRVLPKLPERLGLGGGEIRLPGATINTRGTVRALIFPLSVGERLPAWTDSTIAYHLVGTHRPPTERAAAGFLARASHGLFHLEATIFPHLANVDIAPEALPVLLQKPEGVQMLVEKAITTWASRVNLAAYDNDGADGHPMSGDDDGVLDLTIVLLETDSTPAIVRVPTDLVLAVGKQNRLRVRAGTVYLLTIPRRLDVDAAHMGLVALILGAAGLSADEMFFPDAFDRRISTLARLRLGWIGGVLVTHSGEYDITPGIAFAVPLVDVDRNRGLWLLEHEEAAVYLTRVARKANGHFATVDVHQVREGDPELLLPLTATEGEHGARLRIRWDSGKAPKAHVALTASAVREERGASAQH